MYICRVISGTWVEVTALVAAFVIAVVTTPAGVSGAVLLLPFQVSVLHTPSPAVPLPGPRCPPDLPGSGRRLSGCRAGDRAGW